MITVTILDKEYQLRNEWADNTIKQMAIAQDYIDAMPKWLEQYIYSDKDDTPVSEIKLLEFYIDWILIFSDIPREYLESEIEIKDSKDTSLIELFNLVGKFLGEPTEAEVGSSDTINFEGIDYVFIESAKTAGGIEKLLGGATFKHFAESQALSTLFQKKQYRKWEYIARITAILFRKHQDEEYNELKIDTRAKKFLDLPVSEAYKAYFFLDSHINRLQSFTLTSLTERAGSQSAQHQKPLLKMFTGKLKPMSYLRKVFTRKRG